jgi:hypothetical protein
MAACHFGRLPRVSLLLSNGAPLEQRDAFGGTAMAAAVLARRSAVVSALAVGLVRHLGVPEARRACGGAMRRAHSRTQRRLPLPCDSAYIYAYRLSSSVRVHKE